jgi:hypothetical protein
MKFAPSAAFPLGHIGASGVLRAPASESAALAMHQLRARINASHMASSLSEFACELCLDQVEPEEAYRQVQEKAQEKMVALLDMRFLLEDSVLKNCLEMIVEESEAITLEALTRGNEVLSMSLDILDGLVANDSSELLN